MKKGVVEFLRFVFMIIIVLMHYSYAQGAIHGASVLVDFYFMLSGSLLYKSYEKKSYLNAWDYTWTKIKCFYPKYLLSLLIIYSTHIFSYLRNGMNIGWDLFGSFFQEATLTQGLGLLRCENLNYPCWYLSVLLIAGMILFAIMEYAEKIAVKYILPTFILCGYGYLFLSKAGWEQWEYGMPVLRGLSGMSLGVLIERLCNKKQFVGRGLPLCGVTAICLLMMSIFVYPLPQFILIVLAAIVVLASMHPNCRWHVFDKPIFIQLGSITYEMLIFFAPLMYFIYIAVDYLAMSALLASIFFIIMLVLFSTVVKRFDKLTNL